MSLSLLCMTLGLAHALEGDPAAQGLVDAQAEPVQLQPLAVGCAASACFGVWGCAGAAAWYYLSDPPPSSSPLALDPAYQAAYADELQRRRARWALLGGAAAGAVVVTGTVGVIALTAWSGF